MQVNFKHLSTLSSKKKEFLIVEFVQLSIFLVKESLFLEANMQEK
jgi:hypothetical protein